LLNGTLSVELTDASNLGESVNFVDSNELPYISLTNYFGGLCKAALLLSRNQISGSLPSEIGKWSNLSKLGYHSILWRLLCVSHAFVE
jgi:hypothetical protein